VSKELWKDDCEKWIGRNVRRSWRGLYFKLLLWGLLAVPNTTMKVFQHNWVRTFGSRSRYVNNYITTSVSLLSSLSPSSHHHHHISTFNISNVSRLSSSTKCATAGNCICRSRNALNKYNISPEQRFSTFWTHSKLKKATRLSWLTVSF
jgi:hypothetical protein